MFNKIEAHHRRVIAPMANGVFIAVRTPVAKARLRVMGQPPMPRAVMRETAGIRSTVMAWSRHKRTEALQAHLHVGERNILFLSKVVPLAAPPVRAM